MFLGHFAVGLAGKRVAPAISLGTWFLSVQFVDLVWPLGPPPPNVRTLAFSALAVWIFVPWAWWIDRKSASR